MKKSIDVQQHFNEIELKIRNLAVIILAAIISAVGYSIHQGMFVSVGCYRLPIGTFLLVGGLVAWGAFYFMDKHWYHRLLLGAVAHAQSIEESFENQFPELGLSTAIGKKSPANLFGWDVHSSQKITIFYFFGAMIQLVFLIILLLAV